MQGVNGSLHFLFIHWGHDQTFQKKFFVGDKKAVDLFCTKKYVRIQRKLYYFLQIQFIQVESVNFGSFAFNNQNGAQNKEN